MKRNEEPVHVSSSVEAVTRSLGTAVPPSGTSSPTLANVILTNESRSTASRIQESSIAAGMASFSGSGYPTAASNGGVVVNSTMGTSPSVFATAQASRTSPNNCPSLQASAHQQHIFHQSIAHQAVRQTLNTSIPASSPPTISGAAVVTSLQQNQQQTQNTMHQAFQSMSAGQHGAGTQQFQRLKVEDALSYLDQVKYKFGNQPQVYNDFLDIMKEFKSQSIDTPGVIARVSSLFRGHPELIVGFNTFLPPGYKIEVQAEQVSVSVPGSLGVPPQIHHITHGANPIVTSITQQLEPLARCTPPVQHTCVVTAPQVTIQQQNQGTITAPVSIKEEVTLFPGSGITVKPAAPSPVTLVSSASSTPNLAPSFQSPLHKESSSSPQLSSATHVYSNSSQAAATVTPFGVPSASQPVEFNHAINYVNKIKNRFQGQPDIYKQFLEILHTYQKEQRSLKEGLVNPLNYRPTLTEAEVYAKVAQLFQNQEDLLQEFGQFLPDATNVSRNTGTSSCSVPISLPTAPASQNKKPSPIAEHAKSSLVTGKIPLKRTAPQPILPSSSGNYNLVPNKKPRLTTKDYSIADVSKYGTMNELTFFDKVRKIACRSREVYDNFLRCLVMYNQEIISKSELLQITTPFLSRHPDLLKWFKEFLGLKESMGNLEHTESHSIAFVRSRMERETTKDGKESREREREALEIDYSTCKRLGTSYCALPKSCEAPKCSGRTPLCKEVLNESWVSFPSWSSEDSNFVSSRKTQYEEYIYRTEDERYELDIVLETHMSTIRVLEGVMKKLNRMNPEEAARFKLDDCLGGSSPTIHIRAIRRIYGDKAAEIIEGLKRSPLVAIPVVLRRMKAKEEEWREAQKGFNKIWREQNEKYYLKSLDHIGTNFKQNDVKALRSKALINEIETIYEERNEEGSNKNDGSTCNVGPHLKLAYKSRHKVLDDAADLLIHHAKRQTGITKEDKRRIKTLLRHTIPDIFRHPRQELSEDEREEEDDSEEKKPEPGKPDNEDIKRDKRKTSKVVVNGRTGNTITTPDVPCEDAEDEDYTVFFANNHWYVFLRLHHILCERLSKIWEKAHQLLDEEKEEAAKIRNRPNGKSDSVAVALRLKPKTEVEIEQYYPHFLSMVKNHLDGNLESSNYEDLLREMFGIHAYLAFTLDKVIANAVRQLGHLVTDETCLQCTDNFLEEYGLKYGPRGTKFHAESDIAKKGATDVPYQRRMEQLLTDENLYRIILWHKDDSCTLAVELLDTDSHSSCSGENPPAVDVQAWSSYVERYVGDRVDDSTEKTRRKNDPGTASNIRKPVFLQRNLKQWERRRRKDEKGLQDAKRGDEMELDDHEKCTVVSENLHCVFNVNSYQMVFVANSENFLYKRYAFTRAKQCHRTVTLRMRKHFQDWHRQWTALNVNIDAEKDCIDWLLGKGENLELNTSSKTTKTVNPVEHKAPFGTLVKYRVSYDS